MTGPLVQIDEKDVGQYLFLEDDYISNYTEPEKSVKMNCGSALHRRYLDLETTMRLT